MHCEDAIPEVVPCPPDEEAADHLSAADELASALSTQAVHVAQSPLRSAPSRELLIAAVPGAQSAMLAAPGPPIHPGGFLGRRQRCRKVGAAQWRRKYTRTRLALAAALAAVVHQQARAPILRRLEEAVIGVLKPDGFELHAVAVGEDARVPFARWGGGRRGRGRAVRPPRRLARRLGALEGATAPAARVAGARSLVTKERPLPGLCVGFELALVEEISVHLSMARPTTDVTGQLRERACPPAPGAGGRPSRTKKAVAAAAGAPTRRP